MTLPVTVVIAVRNEAANLPQCLKSIATMERVVVVDSGSTDETCHIAEKYGAEVWQFQYGGGYPKKRQWALENVKITSPWVLLLDADEVVPEELLAELQAVIQNPKAKDGYLIRKGFHFLGQRFRFGGFSHAAVLLFKSGSAKFEHIMDDNPGGLDMEVHERVVVNGDVGQLKTALIHEDFKGLNAYLSRHNQYSDWEAGVRRRYFSDGDWGTETITPKLFGNAQERRRFLKQLVCRLPLEHWVWFLNHYIFRLGFLEGRPGLIACRIRAQYISDVHAKLHETHLRPARALPQSQSTSPSTIPMSVPQPVSSGRRAA
jgi:glycosyltransferase involved in cell wall biosynthesis